MKRSELKEKIREEIISQLSEETQEEVAEQEDVDVDVDIDKESDDIDVDEYIKAFDAAHEQYVESVKVENVYNRFVMFSSKTHHGVQTFGTKERLTLNFFSMAMSGKITPLQKSR